MNPSQVIARLEATSGRLDKERIIRDAWQAGCTEFFEGAKLTYDALVTFGVKKVPLIEGEDDPLFQPTLTWSKFRDVIGKLRKREITGNTARDVLRSASDNSAVADWNGWYRRILLKDLKCGITEATINKVLTDIGGTALEYIIPVFSCQLAKNAEDHPGKMRGHKYLDPKLDGVRIITVLDVASQTVTQYSRDGRQNDRFEAITGALAKLLPKLKQSMVFDGEMVSRSFQDLMKQLNRKDDVDTSDARLALFDILPLDDFLSGECKMPQRDRQDLLVGFMPLIQEVANDRVYVIPKLLVDLDTAEGQQSFKDFNEETIEAGYEGIMVKDPNASYRCKRTDAWMKIKPHITVDLEIAGVEPGTAESRFANTLGNLLCVGYDNGRRIEVSVGSGFTEEQRDQFWANQDKLPGMIVEIKGDALTKSQDSDIWSLRFPTFLRFRDDKAAEVGK